MNPYLLSVFHLSGMDFFVLMKIDDLHKKFRQENYLYLCERLKLEARGGKLY